MQNRKPAKRDANSQPPVASQSTTPSASAPLPKPPVVTPQESNFGAIKALLIQKADAIRRVIPQDVQLTAEGLIQSALQYMSSARDRRLLACTPKSVLYSVITCAALGLDFIDGQAHLISMEKKKNVDGQWVVEYIYAAFWPGYKGLLEVAGRAGYLMDPHEVKANDTYDCFLGTRNEVIHNVGFGERGDTQGFYCVVRNAANHVVRIERLCKADVDAVKTDTDPWKKYYDSMGLKTVVKRAFKFVPKTTRATKLLARVEEKLDAGEEADDLVEKDIMGVKASENTTAV